MKLGALCLIALAAPVSAQDLPAQFSTTGVAANDVLNIRAEPDAKASIVGSFAPDTINIEVLETSADGAWGLVGLPEGNGWVNMTYLAATQVDPAEVPRPLTCLGTEPFWSLGMTAGSNTYSAIGEDARDLTLAGARTSPDGFYVTFEEGPELARSMIVKRGQCSDGMSDRRYGWQVLLFNDAPDGSSVVSGCCTLDGN